MPSVFNTLTSNSEGRIKGGAMLDDEIPIGGKFRARFYSVDDKGVEKELGSVDSEVVKDAGFKPTARLWLEKQ